MESSHVDRAPTRRNCGSGRVWMFAEVRPDYPSDWSAIVAVAAKLGIGTAHSGVSWSAVGS
jgi:hypothetical protein